MTPLRRSPKSVGDWTGYRWPLSWGRRGGVVDLAHIQDGLTDRFALLTGGPRTAPEQQQTLARRSLGAMSS